MKFEIYVSKRNEQVTMKVLSREDKYNTVEIEYLTGDKAGTIGNITTSTLKRWWKKTEVEEDITEVVMEQKKELEIEVPVINPQDVKIMDTVSELTDEEYAKIGLEIAEQAKKKAESHKLVPMPGIEKLENLKKQYPRKSKSSMVDRTNDILAIDAFIGNTYNNKYYESVKCYKIINNGKTVAEVYPRRKEIEVRVKSIKDDFDSDVRYKDGYKYYLPVHYFIDYTSDYIKLIADLIQ